MSTTITMWLGIAFVFLGIIAVILQAWLWSFPMVPDPGGPDPHGRSSAPKSWTNIHRGLGMLYGIIYVVLMIEMVPRLWAYQVELPARTVIHATMGITIGVLLIAKISIIRWFQHFGQALPTLGLMLLLCTLILGTLSIPYALKAHDFGDALKPENLARVSKLLNSVEFDEGTDVASLSEEAALTRGRQILTSKCVVCHDLRTILKKPRTPKSWHSVVVRMMEKPAIRRRITTEDVGPVTAYLVAITPDIQQSKKVERKRKEEQREKMTADPKPDGKDPAAEKPAAPAFDETKAKGVYEEKCSECHELSDVDGVGGKDKAGWVEVIKRMITDNEAAFSPEEIDTISEYLARTKGK